MAQPDLKFALKEPVTTQIAWLEQQNVVAHITFANHHSRTDRYFYGTPPPPKKKGIKDPNRYPFMPNHNPFSLPSLSYLFLYVWLHSSSLFLFSSFMTWKLTKRHSPFMHKRHDCGAHGKFLQFESDNSIRAGKRSHADAIHSVYRWRNFIGGPKIKSITTPNLVASGQFKHNINIEALKKLPTANYSKKFPGKPLIFSIPRHFNHTLSKRKQ